MVSVFFDLIHDKIDRLDGIGISWLLIDYMRIAITLICFQPKVIDKQLKMIVVNCINRLSPIHGMYACFFQALVDFLDRFFRIVLVRCAGIFQFLNDPDSLFSFFGNMIKLRCLVFILCLIIPVIQDNCKIAVAVLN